MVCWQVAAAVELASRRRLKEPLRGYDREAAPPVQLQPPIVPVSKPGLLNVLRVEVVGEGVGTQTAVPVRVGVGVAGLSGATGRGRAWRGAAAAAAAGWRGGRGGPCGAGAAAPRRSRPRRLAPPAPTAPPPPDCCAPTPRTPAPA